MKRFLRQNSVFLILLLSLGVFRTAVADWNTIPSGSMRPTILEGDVVEMRDEVLFINGQQAEPGFPRSEAIPKDHYFFLGDTNKRACGLGVIFTTVRNEAAA